MSCLFNLMMEFHHQTCWNSVMRLFKTPVLCSKLTIRRLVFLIVILNLKEVVLKGTFFAEFLVASSKTHKWSMVDSKESDLLKITSLEAGQEVDQCCILLFGFPTLHSENWFWGSWLIAYQPYSSWSLW